MAVFVKDGCAACGQLVQRLQSSGAEFDLYMVGSRQDDARIRDWAKRAQIDPGARAQRQHYPQPRRRPLAVAGPAPVTCPRLCAR